MTAKEFIEKYYPELTLPEGFNNLTSINIGVEFMLEVIEEYAQHKHQVLESEEFKEDLDNKLTKEDFSDGCSYYIDYENLHTDVIEVIKKHLNIE